MYDALQVALHVGGRRWPIDLLSVPAFPAADGLALDDLPLALERLHAVRLG